MRASVQWKRKWEITRRIDVAATRLQRRREVQSRGTNSTRRKSRGRSPSPSGSVAELKTVVRREMLASVRLQRELDGFGASTPVVSITGEKDDDAGWKGFMNLRCNVAVDSAENDNRSLFERLLQVLSLHVDHLLGRANREMQFGIPRAQLVSGGDHLFCI